MDRRRRRPAQQELVGVIPPVLPIWLLAGLPPDLPGAPHGWPPTADDSVRRATPLDPAAAAAAAATTPAVAGRSGSSRTCHLRSNHRTHHPLLEADPALDPAPAPHARAGRPVHLGGAGRLHPAAPGPRGRRGRAAAVGAASTPTATFTLPGAPWVSAPAVRARLPSSRAETLRMLLGSAQGPALRPCGPSPGHQETGQEAQQQALQDCKGRLTGPAILHAPPTQSTVNPASHRVKSQAKPS